jgi:hypothetical protein
VHRLVCSGYARPGQTGWDLLDTLETDVLLDVAYGEIIAGMPSEQQDEFDRALNEIGQPPEEDVIVEVQRKSDGNVVQISEARLNQIRRNMGGRMIRPKPGQEV